jgi:uncharacterized protein YcnI
MQRVSLAAFAAVTAFSFSVTAHPSVASGPAASNKSQKVTFQLSHGCDGSDTIKIKVTIPSTITSVRGMFGEMGTPSLTRDPNDANNATNVRAITWTKPLDDSKLLASDFGFYEFVFRAKIADVPFTQIKLDVEQTCKAANGTITVVQWDQPPDSTVGEPAAMLTVVPPRITGWNKITMSRAVAAADLPLYFGDAQIVWRGTEAYSSNINTLTMIQSTTGVRVLSTDLAVNDEIWVKY